MFITRATNFASCSVTYYLQIILPVRSGPASLGIVIKYSQDIFHSPLQILGTGGKCTSITLFLVETATYRLDLDGNF